MFPQILYFYLGAIIGSFLNVVIYRLPNQQSIISPRSHCINCKKMIPAYFNLPIISYLMLLGRCNKCRNKISFQYPFVEIITGLLFSLTLTNFSLYESIIINIIICIFICIALIDFQHFIIPLQLIIINFCLILIFCFFFSLSFYYHFLGMVIGFTYLFSIFCITWFFSKKQPMGYGDLLLIIVLGLWLGPLKILLAIFFASLLGLAYWIFLSLNHGYNKNLKIPFGTFLIIASIFLFLTKMNQGLFNIF